MIKTTVAKVRLYSVGDAKMRLLFVEKLGALSELLRLLKGLTLVWAVISTKDARADHAGRRTIHLATS
jgi:hypothetical protein